MNPSTKEVLVEDTTTIIHIRTIEVNNHTLKVKPKGGTELLQNYQIRLPNTSHTFVMT